jgi:uncharacterized protein (TIGR03067 family)
MSKAKLVTTALVLTLGIVLAVGGWAAGPPTPPAPPKKPGRAESERAAQKQPVPAAKPSKEEMVWSDGRKLGGLWIPNAGYDDGKKVPDKQIANRQIEFKGALCLMKHGGHVRRWAYQFDPAKSPKEMDLTPLNFEDFPPGHAKVIKAIYTFDGDQLKISWFPAERDQKRPTTFKGKPGSEQWVWELKRARFVVPSRPAKDPVFVTLKPAAITDKDDAEQKLVKARFNLVLETFRQRYDEYLGDRCSVEALTRSARQLQAARLDLVATVKKQIELREEYLMFTKVLEKWVGHMAMPTCEGDLPRRSMEDYKFARLARIDAEIDLLRAKRTPRPSKPK